MLNPFQIKKPVGMSYALDEGDVLKTKNALSSLGHYEEPQSGSTPWPDTSMFEGLQAFQKEKNLKVDGLMKPGGPTEHELRKQTSARGILPGEWDWMSKPKTAKDPKPDGVFNERRPALPVPNFSVQRVSQPDGREGPISKMQTAHSGRLPNKDEKAAQDTKNDKKTQVAAAPALPLLPWLLGGGLALGTGELLRRQTEDMLHNNGGTIPPLLPAEQEPPLPEKHENPAATHEPTIEIYPGADDFAKHLGTIIDRNERDDTARQIDELRKDVLKLKENKGWKHINGGRDSDDNQVKEFYAPGSGIAFPRPGRKKGDGRKLSGYTDLTIISPDKKHFKHYQTVDVDRNGKPTKRELDNAERIWRNLRNNDGYVHDIFLVPKTWQMP